MNDDRGTVTAYTLVMALAALAMAGLVLDGGLAVATKVRAVEAAQSAARAGARELDLTTLRTQGAVRLDPAAAEAAARAWLARTGDGGDDLQGSVTATTDSITVTVHAHRRTQLLQLVGLESIPVAATATATPIPS